MEITTTQAVNNLPDYFWTIRNPKTLMTTRRLRETLLATDGWIIAHGETWKIISVKIGPNVYEVSLASKWEGSL